MTATSRYVHGTHPEEQRRLADLNALVNQSSLDALRPVKGERTLDVGSGLGQMARAIARATGERVVGIEQSPEQIARATALAEAAGDSGLVEFRAGDALEMPLAASEWGTFDLAYTRFLLEHVSKPQLVVNAMARAVRPGGRVVLSDDDHDALHLWPEPPGVLEVWRAYVATYARNGNDAFIGRKLVAMAYEAGLEPRRIAMPMFGACAGETVFPSYVTNLSVILDGAREQILATGIVTAAEFDAARLALQDWGLLPDATFWYTMSMAEATKP
jgi:SAM-dependent methyltransferase